MIDDSDDASIETPEFSFGDPAPASRMPQRTIDGLGKVRHVLQPDHKNLVAGMIIASLLVAGGVFVAVSVLRGIWISGGQLPWDAKLGWSWFAIALACPIAIGLNVVGCALFWSCFSNWSLSVTVCEAGFEWRTRSSVTRYLWDDMQLVREILVEERLPILKEPLKFLVPTQFAREYLIQFNDGNNVELTVNALRGHGTLGFVAQQEAEARGVPVETVSEYRG